jgi:hypothetical protein
MAMEQNSKLQTLFEAVADLFTRSQIAHVETGQKALVRLVYLTELRNEAHLYGNNRFLMSFDADQGVHSYSKHSLYDECIPRYCCALLEDPTKGVGDQEFWNELTVLSDLDPYALIDLLSSYAFIRSLKLTPERAIYYLTRPRMATMLDFLKVPVPEMGELGLVATTEPLDQLLTLLTNQYPDLVGVLHYFVIKQIFWLN